MVCGKLLVCCCWEVLRFINWLLLFFLFHSLVFFLSVEEKDEDTFRLKFYFGGLRLFSGVVYFPETVEIVSSLRQGV